MSSPEQEESLEEFLARMSDSLEIPEKPQESEDEKKMREYRHKLVVAYTNQYFAHRNFESMEEEAKRFNASLPTWKNIRTNLFRKDSRMFYQDLALATEGLGHDDFIFAYQEQIDFYEEQLMDLMPGTDPARDASDRSGGWIYLREIVHEAKRLSTGGDINQMQ